MNKKIALILACCAATSFAACNETTEWNFTESCGTETKRCVESTIQVCKDGVWVPEVTCEGATPWCDVTTHTCIAKPVAKDCQDGAQKCDQDAVWTCNNGKWGKTADCAADGKVCNNTTYVCDPKAQPEVTCDHNGTKLAVGDTACDGETTLVTCTASEDGTTASLKPTDCSTESKVCGNDAENKAACIDGQQPAPTVKCTRDGDETEYEVGDKYCGDNNTLYTCTLSEDGTTATYQSAACPDATPVCDNTANDCRAYNKCTLNNAPVAHDATVCDGNVSKKCNDGTLEIVKDCATDAQVCLNSTGLCDVAPATSCTDTIGTVENGKTVCKENNVYTCNNTQLSKTTDCTVTEAEAAAHFVSVCTPGTAGADATCVKKCAEDYKYGEGANANKCVAAHDQQCKINTVGDKQVAQYRRAESEGGYTTWENCNTAYGNIQNGVYKCDAAGEQCVYDNQCESGYHEVDDPYAGKSCQHDITNECKDSANAPVELDAYVCMSNTQVGVCQTGENYTATVVPFGAACDTTKGMVCDSNKVGTLFKCACTGDTPDECKLAGSGKTPTLYTCDTATGAYNGVACTTTVKNANPACNTETNACGYECKLNRVVNTDGTACVKCTDPTATSCGEGKYCGADGKCKAVETTSCTADVCKDGFINKCEGAEGAKKYADAVSCIENGVGICAEGGTACTTDVKSCNVNYMKVEDINRNIFTCKKYDTVECTTGVCTDSYYFGCPAAATGEAKRYHSAPVGKPADDANGTWACDVAKGWDLTCTETDLYEVKDGKCTLKDGKCKADTDCSGETPKCNVASNTCVAAPATECTAEAIQCVDETKYKTCTAEGKWDTTEKTVETGLKCEANSLKCIAEIGCVGNISYVCENGESIVENCEDKSKVCEAGACVAGGGTTPAPTKSLIISEVVLSSGKIIEIYNATDAEVDLSNCKIEYYEDGNNTVKSYEVLSGNISSGSTFVLCDATARTKHPSKCGSKTVYGGYQKSYTLALKCNDQFIDVIGKIGDVANNWDKNHITKKCGVVLGDSNPNDDWKLDDYTEDKIKWVSWDAATLGTHKAVCDTLVE